MKSKIFRRLVFFDDMMQENRTPTVANLKRSVSEDEDDIPFQVSRTHDFTRSYEGLNLGLFFPKENWTEREITRKYLARDKEELYSLVRTDQPVA